VEFFKTNTHIDFMKMQRITFGLSAILCILSIFSLTFHGLKFGLDFTGGTQIEISSEKATAPESIRAILETAGFSGIKVQQYGNPEDLLIRLSNSGHPTAETPASKTSEDGTLIENADRQVSAKMRNILQQHDSTITIKRTEFVGSEVGQQLVDQGCLAVFIAILAIMLYIAIRFEFRLAISAAIALCHDTLIVLGIFSLCSIEFDLATLASILAVIGYSLNDKIVVFDRVRENFRKIRRSSPTEIMNASINQTLSRTVMTSLLTLLVIVALLCFGGKSLFGFSLAFFLGIIIGTYSSIFIAGTLALKLGLCKQDSLPKINTTTDGMP
jgi:preprotein translocase subunit SecF